MPVARLTVKNVSTLPAIDGRRTDYVDSTLPGFVLRVSPSGARSYALAIWHNGRKRRLNLGKARHLQLGAARDEARAILARVGHGEEPHRPRHLGGPRLTVAALVERCLVDLQLRPSTRKEWGRLLEAEIRPAIGDRPADELGRAEVREWTRSIKVRSGYTANHAFALLRRAYSWGRREELVPGSPCDQLPMPFAAQPSERVLSVDELWAILRALDRGQRWRPAFVDATRLLLLTGVRRAAVLGMRRDELEGLEGPNQRWVIPGGLEGRSKSGKPHVVPLSAAAVAVVRRRLEATAGRGLLFPAQERSGRELREPVMRWPHYWYVWLRTRVARTLNARRRREGLPKEAVPRWTIHSFRHSIATHLREDLAVTPDVVSLILGHAVGGPRVSRIYDRAERLPERRRALEAWATWLEALQRPSEGPGRILRFPGSD